MEDVSTAASTGAPARPGEPRDRLARAVRFGRVSGGTMLALGTLSALGTILRPLSVGFIISVAVVINGAVEWRAAGRLRSGDRRAPVWLALNQIALGLELLVYAAWQYFTIGPEMIEALLARPIVAVFLGVLSAEEVAFLIELLQPMIRVLYASVGLVAIVGCGGLAWYYHSRRRWLPAAPPVLPSHP